MSNQTTEKIGKVTLDYSLYSGSDLYTDGSIEDELLNIAMNSSGEEYGSIIEERSDWPTLYHFSYLRENIVSWLPISKSDKVLEVGSGCGAITGAFCRKAGEVVSCDLSKKRSLINAHRHLDADNLTIHVGNFLDIEKTLPNDFTYICLIGVFEYGTCYIPSKTPYEDFLKMLKAHLAPEGRLVIAIENKYGMKYFAGCTEDHTGRFFDGIEDYPNGGAARTFSKNKLESLIKGAGFESYRFYYPYPDYKFPNTIFSEARLPGAGELINNMRNFDRDRMVLFDEKKAFNGCLYDKEFETFSNSFLVVTGKAFDTVYVKFSNDRDEKYRIRTEIIEKIFPTAGTSRYVVEKYPEGEKAIDHIGSLSVKEKSLSERYRESGIEVNCCRMEDSLSEYHAEFDFAEGSPLSNLLDEKLFSGDEQGFLDLFNEYYSRISGSDDFAFSDYDLIFSNILVSGDRWTLIDYEWAFPERVSARESALRALYVYLREEPSRECAMVQKVLLSLQATPEDFRAFEKAEADFQRRVNGKHKTLGELYCDFGKNKINVFEVIPKLGVQDAIRKTVQIYEDFGNGFSEEKSYFVKTPYDANGEITVSQTFDGNVAVLRVDPCMECCMVEVQRCRINGEDFLFNDKKRFYTNGKQLNPKNIAVFATEDPNLYFSMNGIKLLKTNVIEINMRVTFLPKEAAQAMAGAVKRIF